MRSTHKMRVRLSWITYSVSFSEASLKHNFYTVPDVSLSHGGVRLCSVIYM